MRWWSLVLHPTELEESSKTGEFDVSILANSPAFPWLPGLLARLQKRALRAGGPDAKLLPLSYHTWAR
eukprot:10726134-Lingulodinium_polyedra.AAC.1